MKDEEDASILLSMCTSAPHLDVHLRCTVDFEGEAECAVIAWKPDDDDNDDNDDKDDDDDNDDNDADDEEGSGSWHTEEDDEEHSEHHSSDEGSAASVSDQNHQSDEDSSPSHLSNGDDGSASHRSFEDLLASFMHGDDGGSDYPQYCFAVDRNNVLESSLNSMKEMSKYAAAAKKMAKSCVVLMRLCAPGMTQRVSCP
jgi:cobalamin biosynthesis protein CobT